MAYHARTLPNGRLFHKGPNLPRRERRLLERQIVKAFARDQGITRHGARTIFRQFIADQAALELTRRRAAEAIEELS